MTSMKPEPSRQKVVIEPPVYFFSQRSSSMTSERRRRRADLLAQAVLALEDVHRAVRDLDGARARNDDDAAVVADDPVAGRDRDAADVQVHADLSEAVRLARVRRPVRRERRETVLADRVDVADRAVDDDARELPLQARFGRQLAPDGRRLPARVDHEHVAFGCACSIASTGFAQSPGAVCTVTAGPAMWSPGWIAWMSGSAPPRCIASEMFGVETRRNSSRSSAGTDALEQRRADRLAGVHRGADRLRRVGRVLGLRERAADDDDRRAGLDGAARGLGVDAARDRDGDADGLRDGRSAS